MTDIDKILQERESRYGEFSGQAKITQDLKTAMKAAPNYHNLIDSHKESLDMIASKIARILNGDPMYEDSWDDIAGYATKGSEQCRVITN